MKRSFVVLAAVAGVAARAQMKSLMPGGGWETLVDDEKGLANFNAIGDANWHPEGGAIVDFEIRAEFFAQSDTNSGVFIRCADPQKIGGAGCYEVNIWDIRPEPKYGTGAIVDVAAVPVPLKNTAGGKWNTYEITAKGSQLTVKLNGVETAQAHDSKHASGPFALRWARA